MLKFWMWFIFAIVLLLDTVIASFIVRKVNGKSSKACEHERKTISITVIKYAMLMILYDLTFIFVVNGWSTLVFVAGGVSVVTVLIDLAGNFSSDKKALQLVQYINLIISVGLSIYLINEIPDDNLQNIVSAMVAALYGGLLTLVGVVWTIKDAKKSKKEDELNAIRPVIYPFNEYNDFDIKQFVPFEFVEDGVEINKIHRIDLGMIKNTDNGILILERIQINGDIDFVIKYSNVLDKNNFAQIVLYTNKKTEIEALLSHDNFTYKLVGKDVLDNPVSFDVELDKNERKIIKISRSRN